jgi:biopolymer transport protein ExbB
MKACVSIPRSFLGLVLGVLMLPAGAHAYWNDEWTARKRLQIDTSAAGANVTDPIGPTAVLIRLTPGNFRFEAAKEDGSDLRFVAGDDKTPLKYHVEKYDALLGEALVWVGLPELKPGAKTDIWLYYKNPKAVPAEDSKGTYDPGMVLVYHFAERGQPPRDSTTWSNNALTTGNGTDGAQIGRGLRLDGTATVTLPTGPSLAWAAAGKMTWSLWVKPAEGAATGVLFSRRDGGRAFVVGMDAGKPFVEVSADGAPQRASAPVGFGADKWHHLAVTTGESIVLYVDGAAVAKLDAKLPPLETGAILGGDSAPVPPPQGKDTAPTTRTLPGLKAEVDELEISKIERPAGYLLAAAISQGSDPGKFLVAGQDEESGGWSTGYFGVIVKSVTLDGWVVIGLLAIMAVVSWMVMASKASYLSAVERSNDQFTERFRRSRTGLRELVASPDANAIWDRRVTESSSLYRLYRIAAEEIQHRMESGQALSAEAIESIRASLDAGLVRENQRLSRRMVLLTIAISGGPFLGLLGTVVGVMITFAAIAAAGDVNVNAIAPGIAAALVATVAGLAVAIPALFGYNWLLTRSKDVTANMQVFVDELVTKIAEAYSDGAGSTLGPSAAPSAAIPKRPPPPRETLPSKEAGR